ncbi:hypothetical protein C8N44_1461, partial [Allosediminivita pacifica]
KPTEMRPNLPARPASSAPNVRCREDRQNLVPFASVAPRSASAPPVKGDLRIHSAACNRKMKENQKICSGTAESQRYKGSSDAFRLTPRSIAPGSEGRRTPLRRNLTLQDDSVAPNPWGRPTVSGRSRQTDRAEPPVSARFGGIPPTPNRSRIDVRSPCPEARGGRMHPRSSILRARTQCAPASAPGPRPHPHLIPCPSPSTF